MKKSKFHEIKTENMDKEGVTDEAGITSPFSTYREVMKELDE